MKVRVKFAKRGVLKYIGHLDLMRYFQKAFRRTDINVLYSKGFNPHMIMSFAAPLGVGLESEGEYFDIETDDNEDLSNAVDKLNEQMAEGIEVLKIFKLPDNSTNAMASVKAADYEIRFDDMSPLSDSFMSAFNESDEIIFTKATKRSEKTFNVKEFIFELVIKSDKVLFIKTDASSAGNLKPQIALEAILNKMGLDIKDYPFHIFRLDLYQEGKNGNLISLGEFNE